MLLSGLELIVLQLFKTIGCFLKRNQTGIRQPMQRQSGMLQRCSDRMFSGLIDQCFRRSDAPDCRIGMFSGFRSRETIENLPVLFGCGLLLSEKFETPADPIIRHGGENRR